jgi:signal transduction histidine kinase
VTIEVGGLSDGFYVEDDGPGIPEQDPDHIFDEDYSGRGGTGIGSSIVEQVSQAHGWEVTVTDSTAGGARFEIRDVSQSS